MESSFLLVSSVLILALIVSVHSICDDFYVKFNSTGNQQLDLHITKQLVDLEAVNRASNGKERYKRKSKSSFKKIAGKFVEGMAEEAGSLVISGGVQFYNSQKSQPTVVQTKPGTVGGQGQWYPVGPSYHQATVNVPYLELSSSLEKMKNDILFEYTYLYRTHVITPEFRKVFVVEGKNGTTAPLPDWTEGMHVIDIETHGRSLMLNICEELPEEETAKIEYKTVKPTLPVEQLSYEHLKLNSQEYSDSISRTPAASESPWKIVQYLEYIILAVGLAVLLLVVYPITIYCCCIRRVRNRNSYSESLLNSSTSIGSSPIQPIGFTNTCSYPID